MNLIESGVSDKLIKNQYLHSNTKNFVQVATQQISHLQKTQKDNALLIQIKTRLENLIKKSNIQMNFFYRDLSAYYTSIGQPDKAISGRDIYNNGKYYPDGAKEFSKKFLINNKGVQNITDEQIILSIINSTESRKAIRDIYEEINSKAGNIDFNTIQKNLIIQLRNIFGQAIFTNTKRMSYQAIEAAIESLFVEDRKRGAYGLNIVNQSNKIQQIANFTSSLGLNDFSAKRQNDLDNLKNTLMNQLKNKNLFSEIGSKYWDDYLQKNFKKETGRSLIGAKKRKFVRFFSQIMSNYNVNLIDVKHEQSLNGFLLEFGMYASTNLPLKYNQEIVSILGQENVVREYITEKYTSTGIKEQGSKITAGQSPSDIEYKGRSGRVYRFQLKNNFNEVSKALSFRSQATIKVSTYLATAFTETDENIKDTLLYLLINAAFLRQYGLGPYNSGENITFKPTDYPIIKEYILFFLQQSYQFLIGYQYDKNIRKIQGITAGNLAYIFKGKYLIPVTAYFYSALEMINKILDSNNTYELNGIGGIAGLPRFKKIGSLSKSNIDFQEEKINLLKDLKYNNEYKYPSALLKYGGSFGRQLYNDLTFERISIVLVINKLEQYFK